MSRSSGTRRATPRRSRLRSALAVVAVVLVLTLAVIGLGIALGGSEDPAPQASPTPTPSPSGTPLTDVDTRVVAVARQSFCAAVAPESVVRALGEVPGRQSGADSGDASAAVTSRTWDNGQAVRLESGLEDVAHEYGCAWRAPGGRVARAWVFTPPVTPGEARTLSRTAADGSGCETVQGAAAYGAGSVSLSCTGDGSRTRSWRGLFGDGWLTCELSEPTDPRPALTPDVALPDRASDWCSAVLDAAGSVPEPSESPAISPATSPSTSPSTSGSAGS